MLFGPKAQRWEEEKRALIETKGGKAPGLDGVRVEMLKEGGGTALGWLVCLMYALCHQ